MPAIFRYLDKACVEHFFSTGELRLSTFESCRGHIDPIYADQGEGSGVIRVRQGPERLHTGGIGVWGLNGYVLCASVEESQSMMDLRKRDGYIKILDPSRLLRDVAIALGAVGETCVDKFEGYCVYDDERAIESYTDQPLIPQAETKERDEDGNPLFSEEEAVNFGDEASRRIQQFAFRRENLDFLFVKPLRYSVDKEYRLVWFVNGDSEKPRMVSCPDAWKYCSRGSI